MSQTPERIHFIAGAAAHDIARLLDVRPGTDLQEVRERIQTAMNEYLQERLSEIFNDPSVPDAEQGKAYNAYMDMELERVKDL